MSEDAERLALIAEIADVLEDMLLGDDWPLAHLIWLVATKHGTMEEALKDWEELGK